MSKTPAASIDIGSLTKKDTTTSILIIGLLFFIFGFVSWVNAILIPYFKIACELTHFKAYLVTFAFYISYFIMSVPSSFLLKKTGFKKGMMIGFWAMSLGAFIFVPAALTRTYEIFLVGLFTIGAGLAILQTAANPYITVLGPKESAAQRISIMGIFNKGAGIIAPLLFAAVILKATDTDLFGHLATMNEAEKNRALDELIQRVIVPYVCVGSVLFGLGLMIRFSPLPEINTDVESIEEASTNTGQENNIPVSPFDLRCCSYLSSCGYPGDSHRYDHWICKFYECLADGSKIFSFLHVVCNDMRLYTRHHHHSKIYKPGKCLATMYCTGHAVYVAHYLHAWTGCFFGPRYRCFHLVCRFIRFCQFIGVGRHLAVSIRWPGQVYQARRFDHDHGLMRQRYSSAFLWLAG